MLSHMVAFGSRLRVGVRGGGIRNSDRDATRSNEGRDEVPLLVAVRDDEDGCERLRPVLVALFRATLRSVWRLFWNHIVTDLVSLEETVSVTRKRGLYKLRTFPRA